MFMEAEHKETVYVSGCCPLLEVGILNPEEFFPIWNQLPLRMLKEVEP